MEIREIDRFLAQYLEPDARPELGRLLGLVTERLAGVRVVRGASHQSVAGYVLYRLSSGGVTRLLEGSPHSGRDLTDDDLAVEPAGWYIAALAAASGYARYALTDMTAQTIERAPLPLFARGATEAGRRLMATNGFLPLPPPSQIWWRPAASTPPRPHAE